MHRVYGPHERAKPPPKQTLPKQRRVDRAGTCVPPMALAFSCAEQCASDGRRGMRLQALGRGFRNLILCLVLLLSGLATASAETSVGSLQGFLVKATPSEFFAGADRFGPQQGS